MRLLIYQYCRCIVQPILLSGFLLLSSVLVQAQDLIVNPSVSVTNIKLKELRAMYAMRRVHWPDGSPVNLVVYANDSPLHKVFSKELLAVFPHQLQTRWDKLVYSGRAAPPVKVNDEQAMIDYVAKTPGAIGYISSDHERPIGVRVISVTDK